MSEEKKVGAYVVLRDGCIFEWKSTLGRVYTKNNVQAYSRYEGEAHVGVFDSFEEATQWMKQWPVHKDAPGWPPYETPKSGESDES